MKRELAIALSVVLVALGPPAAAEQPRAVVAAGRRARRPGATSRRPSAVRAPASRAGLRRRPRHPGTGCRRRRWWPSPGWSGERARSASSTRGARRTTYAYLRRVTGPARAAAVRRGDILGFSGAAGPATARRGPFRIPGQRPATRTRPCSSQAPPGLACRWLRSTAPACRYTGPQPGRPRSALEWVDPHIAAGDPSRPCAASRSRIEDSGRTIKTEEEELYLWLS